MKIFVGLGNPGSEYAATKHNVGFMLADAIAKEINANNWRENFNALISENFIEGEKIFLVKPLTYMNSSGEAVRPIMDYYKLTPEDLIVAHDDMDLSVGIIRLRPKGSGGGHHGIESIIQHLNGNQNFSRIRIGIGRPPFNENLIPKSESPYANSKVNRHVLSPFNEEDAIKIKSAIEYLVPATLCIIREGINNAMNKYNPKKKKIAEVNEDEKNNGTLC